MTENKRPLPWTSAAVGLVVLIVATWTDTLPEVGTVFTGVSFVLASVFFFRYVTRPWKQTLEGQYLLRNALVIGLFLAYALINRSAMWLEPGEPMNYGHWPGRNAVGLILYMGVSWELWNLNWLLTVANRERRLERLKA